MAVNVAIEWKSSCCKPFLSTHSNPPSNKSPVVPTVRTSVRIPILAPRRYVFFPQVKCVQRRFRGIANQAWTDGELVRGRTKGRRATALNVSWGKLEPPKPTFVALEQITGEEHFDQILSEAQQRSQPVIIDWMAAWCRKCIYLKPKLEKLAAEFHPDIKFYYVDVNTVSQSLVKRADVVKMPTIQLWQDGQKQGEVIGGHHAWLVLDEIRDMIKKRA